MNDTPTILVALDAGIDALSRRSEDATRDGDSLKFGSDLQNDAYLRAREINEQARTLRTLRTRIEKERELLSEAAGVFGPCWCKKSINYTCPQCEWRERYRSLISEKPPEEGAK